MDLNLRKEKLIQFILKKNIKKIPVEIVAGKKNYFILKEAGLDSDDYEILNYLSKENILKPVLILKPVRCPYCKSLQIFTLYQCPYCNSYEIEHENVYQHRICGYTGLESSFSEKCPFCNKKIIKEDLEKKAHTFKCLSCNQTFVSPLYFHKCLECNKTFSVYESELESIFEYEINEKEILKIKDKLEHLLFLKDFLINNGFEVKENEKIKGKSGIEHMFRFVLKKKDKTIAAIEFVDKIYVEYLLSIYVKILDIPEIKIVVISPKEIKDENILKIVKLYNIQLIAETEIDNMLKRLEKILI